MAINHADLMGKPVAPEMLERLNKELAQLTHGTNDPYTMLAATATVYGTSSNDAYLGVEMVMSGFEMSPFILNFPLPCSTHGSSSGVNKEFHKLPHEPFTIISTFWRNIAFGLVYRGNGLSVEASRA